jgi:hypothetical protein
MLFFSLYEVINIFIENVKKQNLLNVCYMLQQEKHNHWQTMHFWNEKYRVYTLKENYSGLV